MRRASAFSGSSGRTTPSCRSSTGASGPEGQLRNFRRLEILLEAPSHFGGNRTLDDGVALACGADRRLDAGEPAFVAAWIVMAKRTDVVPMLSIHMRSTQSSRIGSERRSRTGSPRSGTRSPRRGALLVAQARTLAEEVLHGVVEHHEVLGMVRRCPPDHSGSSECEGAAQKPFRS